ncbi:MAG: aminoacyl-tRNA deacylase [Acidobacteriia bacterium]|nr:aminoacyl-tRNA deacylase [Terriglobia bacterium]
MSHKDFPVTNGVRFLRQHKVSFVPHLYPYEPHGGTGHAAKSLGVQEHAVIKTLVMETFDKKPLLVLMHGDCEVSTQKLARALGVKDVNPALEKTAERLTGYQVGGISPFGTRTVLSVYVEKSILSLPRIYINGGKRGFLVEIDPKALCTVLSSKEVEVGNPIG